jgi:hypothetical protein
MSTAASANVGSVKTASLFGCCNVFSPTILGRHWVHKNS